jgi:Zn2+/Cd2+-exporting ATPase
MIKTFLEHSDLRQKSLNVLVSFLIIVLARIFFEDSQVAPWLWGMAFIIGGYYKAIEGFEKSFETKALNVEFLMIMAAVAAFITKDYQEGAVLIFIFALSGVLETYANLKSERALTKLLELSPKTAIKLVDQHEVMIDVQDLKIKDVVIVKAGQHVPADGVVIRGSALINQAAITGEFIAVSKQVGDPVYSGSLNEDSTLFIEVTKDPKESTVQKIVDFVKEAQSNQTKAQTIIERFEMWYVYVVIGLAVLFFMVPYAMGWLSFEDALYRGIIVLVVGSPCAVVASITPAILSTLSYGANNCILIKGGQYLEDLSRVSTVVFDKTGTITTGQPTVIDMYLSEGYELKEVQSIVSNIERQSNHPLALAISAHFASVPHLAIESTEVPGQGMSAEIDGKRWFVGRYRDIDVATQTIQALAHEQGYTLVDIVCEDQWIGYISLQDTLRPEAKALIEQLHQRKIKVHLLTGDQSAAANAIAQSVNIEHVHANCLPEDKVNIIKAIKADHEVVLMVGDGINDAPSLALAHIGAAMGNAMDVTLETADLIFVNSQLTNITKILDVSQKMKRIITQNLIFSISVIVMLLLSNVIGIVALPMGVLAHEGSTILVILNSLRLLVSK